jgi:hypothetical protein
MEVFDSLNSLALPPWLLTFMSVIAGAFWLYRIIYRGNTKIDEATITALKNQIDAIRGEFGTYKEITEKTMGELKQQLLNLTQLVGKQEGIIEVKNQQLQHYEEIFKNRNPELTQVLTEIRDFMKDSQRELKSQTTILKEIKVRNDSIDRAHGSVAHPTSEKDISIKGTMTTE